MGVFHNIFLLVMGVFHNFFLLVMGVFHNFLLLVMGVFHNFFLLVMGVFYNFLKDADKLHHIMLYREQILRKSDLSRTNSLEVRSQQNKFFGSQISAKLLQTFFIYITNKYRFVLVKHHFLQYFSYTMVVSLICRGIRIKSPTCRNSLTNVIT
jgi:hypothetical protein